jgi:hypothetical protein
MIEVSTMIEVSSLFESVSGVGLRPLFEFLRFVLIRHRAQTTEQGVFPPCDNS